MANITLNIEEDLNIYVSEEDGQPDSLYLDGMDGCPETLRIHLEADGKDDESKAEVIYAIPGAAAISMTLYEALSLALNSGGADSLELMPVSGIFIAFNSDDVIIDQSGDCYLAGPGIIFALEKIIRNIVQVSFIRPKERPYKTNNFYSAVVRQEKLDKEVQKIVQGEKAHKSGKAAD